MQKADGQKNIDSVVLVVYIRAPAGCCYRLILLFFYSSIAQLVEQVAVNHLVASSSLARGAKNTKPDLYKIGLFFLSLRVGA